MPTLSFLPDLATELYEVLTDPLLGACQSALPSEGLLHDADREQVLEALEEAFTRADADSATLLIALLGHGVARDDDFYYLSIDATGRGRSRTDVHLSQQLKELLRDNADLDGLLVLLDTCHAGVAAQQAAAQWGQVGLGRNTRRYEVLSASANEPAYGGDFTRTIIRVLRSGVPAAGSTVDARYLRAPLQEGTPAQRPQRVTVDGGGWAQTGDEGLWLAYNAAWRGADDDAASLVAQDHAAELTAYLQSTPALDALVAATREHRCVMVTGPRGSGKSTLAAALTRPLAARGRLPEVLAQAITFAGHSSTMASLAAALAGQLTATVPGFAQAKASYGKTLEPAERQGLSAMQRRVVGPLSQLQLDGPVRLVLDAVDELPDAAQRQVRDTVTGIASIGGSSGTASLAFVLTARPGAARPAGAYVVQTSQPGDQVIASYLRQRGVADNHVPPLVAKAAGSWLHARLLAEQAIRPGFDPRQLPQPTPELTAMYEGELLRAGADDLDLWQTQLRPVLAVLAVAGSGPVLSLPVAVAASARLGGPGTVSRLRDVVVRLSGLIVRSSPGQPSERLGIFHISLADDYLLRPDIQFPIDPIEARAALAQAGDENFGENFGQLLSNMRRDIQLNLRVPILPTDLSATRNILQEVIEMLPQMARRSGYRMPLTAPSMVSRLKDEGYRLLEDIESYKMLADHFYSDSAQEARLRRRTDEVSVEIDIIAERSRYIRKRILKYLRDAQLVITY
jgi:energy-coupling factor transporter ATP-binding protein EcfA2